MKPNPIRQSFTDWSATAGLNDAAAVDLYGKAASAGYAAVEMAPPHRWQAARDAGLALLNISAPGMDDGLNRPENHATLLARIGELIDVAAQENIAQIIVFSGKRKGQDDADGVRNCAKALKQLAPLAQQKGVILLLELLGQKCHPDNQADNIGFGAKIVRAVSSPAVKLLYDIYHMNTMGEAVIPAIIQYLDCIGHVHVASPKDRGEPKPFELEHATIVREITSAGYQGMWGQEFLVDAEPAEALSRAFALFSSF